MDIVGNLKSIASSAMQTVDSLFSTVDHSSKLVSNFMKAGKKTGTTLGDTVASGTGIVANTLGVVESFMGAARDWGEPVARIIFFPLVSVQNGLESVLKPVNRLLGTFNLAVDRVFDGIDGWIGNKQEQPVPVPVPVTVERSDSAPRP